MATLSLLLPQYLVLALCRRLYMWWGVRRWHCDVCRADGSPSGVRRQRRRLDL